ncbi:MAG TPA: response regulator transcription factor [Fibrella sp.]
MTTNGASTQEEFQISIAIGQPFALLASALRSLLESQGGYNVVAEATTGPELMNMVVQHKPDIVLYDPNMDTADGQPSTARVDQIRAASHESRILVLTDARQVAGHRQALLQGASGLVLKERPANGLLDAVERVHAGEVWIDRSIMADFMTDVWKQRKREQESGLNLLTKREREVAVLVGKGMRNKQVATQLFLSETTVRHHLTSVYEKLGISGRQELLLFAMKHGVK